MEFLFYTFRNCFELLVDLSPREKTQRFCFQLNMCCAKTHCVSLCQWVRVSQLWVLEELEWFICRFQQRLRRDAYPRSVNNRAAPRRGINEATRRSIARRSFPPQLHCWRLCFFKRVHINKRTLGWFYCNMVRPQVSKERVTRPRQQCVHLGRIKHTLNVRILLHVREWVEWTDISKNASDIKSLRLNNKYQWR